MCFAPKAPPAPQVPALPPELPPPPSLADPSVGTAKKSRKQAAALAGGRNRNIATSGLGLEGDLPGVPKELLGA